LFSIQPGKTEKKVKRVKDIYEQSGAAKATKKAIALYTKKAFLHLDTLSVSDKKKNILRQFGESLMGRKV
jgi:geranylgeranyl diphosphate synthase type II